MPGLGLSMNRTVTLKNKEKRGGIDAINEFNEENIIYEEEYDEYQPT